MTGNREPLDRNPFFRRGYSEKGVKRVQLSSRGGLAAEHRCSRRTGRGTGSKTRNPRSETQLKSKRLGQGAVLPSD